MVLEKRTAHNKLEPEVVKNIIRRVEMRMPLCFVAREYGVSERTVNRIMKEHRNAQ